MIPQIRFKTSKVDVVRNTAWHAAKISTEVS